MARKKLVTGVLRLIGRLMIASGGVSARELTKRLRNDGDEWELRQVYRKIKVAGDAGFPITNEGLGRDWQWQRDSIASIQFSHRKLTVPLIALNSIASFRGSPAIDAIQGFTAFLERVVGPLTHAGLSEVYSCIGSNLKPTWKSDVTMQNYAGGK